MRTLAITSPIRLPVGKVPATLSLHDGERIAAELYVAPGLAVREILDGPRRFLPAESGEGFLLIARESIAYITVSVFHANRLTALPLSRRSVVVRMRSGSKLCGDLLYIGAPGYGRVGDHLEQEGDVIELEEGDERHLVAKRHVVWIEEA